jgi:hypothetical protein
MSSKNRIKTRRSIETFAIGMSPCGPDARPVALFGIFVAHMIGDVAARPGSDGFGFG